MNQGSTYSSRGVAGARVGKPEGSSYRKRQGALRRATAGVVVFAGAGLLALSLSAQTARAEAQWDNDGIDAPAGGPGQWDAVSPRWFINGQYVPYPGSDDFVFGGTAGGAIQLVEETTFANSLTFAAPGYALVTNGITTGANLPPFLTLGGTGVIDTGAFDVEIFPKIAGAVGLTKRGTGTLVFHGGNTFTGNTVVEAGTLALGNTLVADLPTSTNITINQGATLSLAPFGGAFNDTVGAVTGAGNIVLAGSPGFGVATGSHLTM